MIVRICFLYNGIALALDSFQKTCRFSRSYIHMHLINFEIQYTENIFYQLNSRPYQQNKVNPNGDQLILLYYTCVICNM